MRKIFILPNLITAFSLASGLFVIFKVNMIEPGTTTYKLLLASSFLLLFAAFADWVDGAIARVMHAESEFGFLFDSLSDAVTFGVAPSVLTLKSLSLQQGTPVAFFAIFGSMVFSICGILRLVRFNVTMAAIKKLPKHKRKKYRHFIGLPIPAAALAVVALNLLFSFPLFRSLISIGPNLEALILGSCEILLGYFMLSRFKFPSAKALHFRVPSFGLVFFGALFAFFFLYGIIYFFPLTFAAVIWAYIFLSWSLILIRKIVGKRSKTLSDFEPHTDD